MYDLIASLASGLLVGAVYGLAAIGLTLIFGVMKVINLTHGAMIALGMFALYFLVPSPASTPICRCCPYSAAASWSGSWCTGSRSTASSAAPS